MIVKRIGLQPGVSLTCVTTDKFKSSCFTVNLICKLTRETASLNALLPRVLRRGSKKLPDIAHISATLDDLYGTRIEPIARKKGELYALGFYADFPDDRYIPGCENLLEKAFDITGELLLSPAMQDGFLREDYIESEKSNLIDNIRAAINDKRGYSITRLLEQMCADETYGVSRLGTEQDALSITKESLTAHYNDIINNSQIELFYCGCAGSERVEAALQKSLQNLPLRTTAPPPVTDIVFEPNTKQPRRFTDSLDVTQGQLVIGFRIGHSMSKPNYPAIMMFNAIYGDDISSKLFVNVREKLSLCYFVSSMIDKHKGIMLVSSGVEFSDFDKALDEILLQLENVKNGDITENEFSTAKQSIISEIKSVLDRPGGLEELYFDSVTASVKYDPLKLCEAVENVTPEQVQNVASGVKTDSIYLLTNDQEFTTDEASEDINDL